MNYTMIYNKPCPHTHTSTNPSSPPRATRLQKIGFVAPILASAEISKTMTMLSKHGYYDQCHNTHVVIPVKIFWAS